MALRKAHEATVLSSDYDRLWTVTDVSVFLGVPVATLHQWRYLGQGPKAFRVGRHLRYDPAWVRQWLMDSCLGGER